LNHRPLGYEDNYQLVRLCLFNRLAAGVSCCFPLAFGVLFADCSYICSHFLTNKMLGPAQRCLGNLVPPSAPSLGKQRRPNSHRFADIRKGGVFLRGELNHCACSMKSSAAVDLSASAVSCGMAGTTKSLALNPSAAKPLHGARKDQFRS